MKLPTRNRKRGAAILLLVVVGALAVIGYGAWKIYQAACRIGERRAALIERGISDGKTNIEAQVYQDFPGQHVQIEYTSTNIVTAFDPWQDTNRVSVRIYRSTNLVDWELMVTLGPGETWTDSNPPAKCGFYRREIVQ